MNSKSEKGLLFFLCSKSRRKERKMKNIEEKILMADEEIKQLQNKKKSSLVSRNRKKEKREIKEYMKREQSLKVSLLKVKI